MAVAHLASDFASIEFFACCIASVALIVFNSVLAKRTARLEHCGGACYVAAKHHISASGIRVAGRNSACDALFVCAFSLPNCCRAASRSACPLWCSPSATSRSVVCNWRSSRSRRSAIRRVQSIGVLWMSPDYRACSFSTSSRSACRSRCSIRVHSSCISSRSAARHGHSNCVASRGAVCRVRRRLR